MSDWHFLANPSVELVEALAPIPGVKFRFRGRDVVGAEVHRSVWPLFGGTLTRLPSPTCKPGFAPYLRDYQRSDVPFLVERRASILGYEMRLGKTATATACWNPSAGPILIVGPLIARDVWRDWIRKVHQVDLLALETRDDTPLPGFQAYFCHFDILDAHSAFLQSVSWSLVVIDEIHLMQARRSQRMTAMSLICAKAAKLIGLSGTPMWSDPRSMWPVLNLLAPSAWGTEFDFSQRYTNATQGPYGWRYEGVKNSGELQQRLSEVICKRTWKEVAPELPATVNVVEAVSCAPGEAAKLEMKAERMRLASTNPNARVNVAAHMATLRKQYGMLKVKRAVELAMRAMNDSHKVVLWTWHTEVADSIRMPGYSFYQLTAEQSQDTRAHFIKCFQGESGPACMLVPLAVGGVAISLDSADVNIFVEVDWIPATNYQASMRVFKPSRPHSNVWLFLDVPVERGLLEVLGANEACQNAVGLGYDEIASKVLGGAA